TARTQTVRSTATRTPGMAPLTSVARAHRRTVSETSPSTQRLVWKESDMIAGHPESFGIEAELLEIHGKWTYGRLRFWVGGVEVGDFDDTSDLATSARWGRTFLAASSRRTRPDLDRMLPKDVYQLLYGRFIREVRRVGATP